MEHRFEDWEGNYVKYPDGYPDFEGAGMVIQEVPMENGFSYYKNGELNRPKDFRDADKYLQEKIKNGEDVRPKGEDNTWHHHQSGKKLQEIDGELHGRFRHRGEPKPKNN